MATVQVTETTFAKTVAQGIVVLDFWASWCGPCRMFGPIFEAASRRHPDVVFGKVDADAEPGLASALRVRSLPTMMALRDGLLLSVRPGLLQGHELDALVRRVRAVDLDEVRRRIEGAPAAPRVAQGGA